MSEHNTSVCKICAAQRTAKARAITAAERAVIEAARIWNSWHKGDVGHVEARHAETALSASVAALAEAESRINAKKPT